MKKLIYASFLVVATTAFIFTGCKKDTTETATPTEDYSSQQTSANDASQVQSESDQAAEDANAVIGGYSSVSGRFSANPPLCGATTVLDSATKTITITYDGTGCNGKNRTGVIKVQLTGAMKWKEPNATVTITFVNYKVTRANDNKSITMNGSKSITNLTGGLIWDGTTVTHRIRANDLSITFDNGTVKSWKLARKITYHSVGSMHYIKLEGDTTVDGHSNTVMWGLTRDNETFYDVITKPIEANNSCGWHRPTSGERGHSGAKNFNITFGFADKNGGLASGTCASFYRLNFVNAKGVAKEYYLPY